ncbi:MAG: hypothetical protein C0459_07780 [Chitinophaga sp.]|jgi:hypothetical protein|nr:hypothetical protein [Chitinophaga sp.]
MGFVNNNFLTNEELHSINKVDEQELKKLATFGVFAIDDDWNNFVIKANKEGLQLFATELWKASQKMKEKNDSDYESNIIIPLVTNAEWINSNSDIKISVVEQINKVAKESKLTNKNETVKEKIVKYGCVTILILILIAMFIGMWTLVKWIF